jgi:predicted nucleotidyltransferase component of viral defense system
MKRDVKNLSASVQGRLQNEARKLGRPIDWIYKYYASERLLYRLSQSEYCKKFILKGGLIFMGWGTPLRRHTKDIDLRAYIRNELKEVIQIIKDVCAQNVEPDGMEYLAESVTADAILEEAEFPGIRVHLWARLGKTNRIRMQIDMGFSDDIVPPANIINYPTILSELPGPILQGYPKEAVIAEKLHCIIDRGRINSRMKDFYDLWFIIIQFNFKGEILQDAIINTFTQRRTLIPNDLPVGFSDDFVKEKSGQWRAFLNTFNPEFQNIYDFMYVIHTLRNFIIPIFNAISEGKPFDLSWNARDEWTSL